MAKKEQTKKFVKIHSDITITVTPGLQNKDVTDTNSRVGDKLRIIPTWQNGAIQITKGEGIYPAEITEWFTVKRLAEIGTITIGAYVNDIDNVSLKSTDVDKKIEKAKNDAKTLEEANFTSLEDIVEGE